MARQTDEGLILFKRIGCYRAVGVMADHAVIHDGGMFEDKGALLIMIFETGLIIDMRAFCRYPPCAKQKNTKAECCELKNLIFPYNSSREL